MNVSVVVPVYNGAHTLAACLDALVRQVPPGADLIVVDDASTDATAAIAERYPVRLFRHPINAGASAARNTGLAATESEIVIFVDADVAVRPGAIAALLRPLADPDVLGSNGLFDLQPSVAGVITAFANTSIHYQHLCHGTRVSSAFTGLCALRRSVWGQEEGFDERTSRFADDVSTRWHLPVGCLVLVPEALGDHQKGVRLGGLLRHRQQVGWHFLKSIAENRGAARARPGNVLLAARYPLNTAIAAGSLLLVPFGLPVAIGVSGALFLLVNIEFALFTLRKRGPLEAAIAIPVSALEGYAYGLGMARFLLSTLRSPRVRAPAPAR